MDSKEAETHALSLLKFFNCRYKDQAQANRAVRYFSHERPRDYPELACLNMDDDLDDFDEVRLEAAILRLFSRLWGWDFNQLQTTLSRANEEYMIYLSHKDGAADFKNMLEFLRDNDVSYTNLFRDHPFGLVAKTLTTPTAKAVGFRQSP